MKKRLTSIAIATVFSLWMTGVAWAASDTSAVSVTVSSIDSLSVSAGGTITLTGTAGSNSLTGTDDTTAALDFTHNNATAQKITAEATTNPASHTITLTVSVADGAGSKTLVTSGTAAAAQDVYTAISAGTLTSKTVTYGASATASGTTASTYNFVITYTSADNA